LFKYLIVSSRNQLPSKFFPSHWSELDFDPILIKYKDLFSRAKEQGFYDYDFRKTVYERILSMAEIQEGTFLFKRLEEANINRNTLIRFIELFESKTFPEDPVVF